MLHDGVYMTRLKVKVTEVQMLRKSPISKCVSSANMYAIKRLMVNYDTSILNCNWTDF